MLRELLAANIARAFAEKRFSKKELSEKIGVHPNIVGRWVAGKSAPELDNVELLAVAFGKKPTWVSAGWNSGICARRMSGPLTR